MAKRSARPERTMEVLHAAARAGGALTSIRLPAPAAALGGTGGSDGSLLLRLSRTTRGIMSMLANIRVHVCSVVTAAEGIGSASKVTVLREWTPQSLRARGSQAAHGDFQKATEKAAKRHALLKPSRGGWLADDQDPVRHGRPNRRHRLVPSVGVT
ncbi:uncharacterized protein F5Z01DRAFT_639852 [Emericellopsis atlantica]|uniref:Uncharacterized protein n=1 Tax=Emericellopsis atlantica TaxID=2614577 RepID=A0A9P8CL23_9HYPO|nr:uncharacterized protein F5Z01DRAFT_639852 [Emericellopsis atlantica]KAG9250948.1 hypothetical protein F5Z01DRAFT_639852 [Emericellopsis atlantica]